MVFSKRRRRTRRSIRGGKRKKYKTKRHRKSRRRRSRKSRRRKRKGGRFGFSTMKGEQLVDEDECFSKTKPCGDYWFRIPGDRRPKVCRNPQWGETCANVGAWNGQYKNK